MRWLLIILLIAVNVFNGKAQSISIKGRVIDDTVARAIPNSVAMAVRLSDSVLVKFCRSDSNGFFRLESLPLDTYQVVISHSKFSERTFIIMGNKNDSVIEFKSVVLPIKSTQIAEVTIYGFASPVYFRGDTLIYAADSFKVKPNAVVEDLLKKLPGIMVDGDGKIYAQGQQVDKVLVDGDEFFGSDPTIATRNLAAGSVESVKVYEQKSKNSSDENKEMEKVLDLRLKEDAKKGYFGRIEGGSDFDKFFEEQLLANRFRGKQKISVFSKGGNTVNSKLSWQDIDEYGLNNESNFSYSEEDDTYTSSMNTKTPGVSRNFRNGIYYSDKLFKETNITLNYTNSLSDIKTDRGINSQYLFPDTSYYSNKKSNEVRHVEGHAGNFNLEQKIDSLTYLYVYSNLKINSGNSGYKEQNQILDENGALQRRSDIDNSDSFRNQDIKNTVWLYHDFKKKGRELNANYQGSLNNSDLIAKIYSEEPNDSTSIVNQEKTSKSGFGNHKLGLVYFEPLSKKIKVGADCDLTAFQSFQNKLAFDYFNDSYNLLNDSLTNRFENNRQENRVGLKLIYDIKKTNVQIGGRARQISQENVNLETNDIFSQTVNSLLPYAKFSYNFSDNSRLSANYLTSSKLPELNQLQPVSENANPNSLYIGNPSLQPTYNQIFTFGYNSFKAVSGNSVWTNVRFVSTQNAFSNSIRYDVSGVSTTQPINVDGNYNGSFNVNYSLSLFSRKLVITPAISSTFNRAMNIVNDQENITKTLGYTGSMFLILRADSGNLEITLRGNYGNSNSQATLSDYDIESFVTAGYKGTIAYDLPSKWKVYTDLVYTTKTQPAGVKPFNIYLWGASISKKVFKSEALEIALQGFDLLNQNIDAEQTVSDNVISYSRSNLIGRYVLLKAIYKFKGTKASAQDE